MTTFTVITGEEDFEARIESNPDCLLPWESIFLREKKKRMTTTTTFTVITGEDLEAHKAEWIESNPDCLPPWESKYGAAMNDETQWPPIWKERIEECPEYEVLAPYLLHNSSDFKYSTLLLQQLRESRGYDATVSMSCDELICYTPSMMREFRHISTAICKYVTDKINDRAKMHNESYVFDEVKKICRIPGQYFYTFTVKEGSSYALKTVQAYVHSGSLDGKLLVYLKEWRFKPE